MGKSLIGFVVGVVVTTFAFYSFDSTRESAVSDTQPTAAAGTEASADVADAIVAVLAAQAAAGSFMEDGAAPETEFRSQFGEAGQLDAEAIAALGQPYFELATLELVRTLAGMPIVSPTPLPPEFDWMAANPWLVFFHEQFQREYIDSAWAAPTQADLERLVYDRPGIIEKYGPPTIRCHSTRCEVLFVASGDRVGAGNDVEALHDAALDLMPGVFDCEAGNCWAVARNEDGVTSLFWGMERKQQ